MQSKTGSPSHLFQCFQTTRAGIAVALLSAGLIGASALAQGVPAPNGVSEDGSVVIFHIRTPRPHDGPWNARETAVEVKVGQILRLVNDDYTDHDPGEDGVKHYLHTPGVPCEHGSAPFADTYDCVITAPSDPDRNVLYDHNFGPQARFFVHATE